MSSAVKKTVADYPELLKQWDYERNGDLKPEDVTAGNGRKIHWKCPIAEDHRWEARVAHRTNGNGCPCCAGKKVVPSNCLGTTHPHLFNEWDFERNGNLMPEHVTAGTGRKIHWKCNVAENHRWEAPVCNRTNGRDCPYCHRLKIVMSNCLATTHPDLADQWDYERNGNLRPEDVAAGSGQKIHWKCNVAEDHRWEASPNRRTNSYSGGHGCPYCAGKKVVLSNCLTTTHPHLLSQWDYEKNGDISPEDVTAGSGQKVHWKCPVAEDHRYEAQVASRTNGHGCPCCHGLKVVPSNCLATTHPYLIAQWDYERNGDLSPENVTGSNKKVWWRCPVATDHRWKTQVSHRTIMKSGCPICNASKGEELIAKIFEEKGIIFTRQWSAKDCRHKMSLRFDFAVMVEGYMVALIEYQGQQHYQSVERFGGEKALAETQHRDAIKRTYCQTNNIPLLEVHYEWRETENKVEKELVKFLTSLGL